MVHPDGEDIIIRPKAGERSNGYVLGTPSAPDQFIVRTREEAESRALAYARRQGVRAWFVSGGDAPVLLSASCDDQVTSV